MAEELEALPREVDAPSKYQEFVCPLLWLASTQEASVRIEDFSSQTYLRNNTAIDSELACCNINVGSGILSLQSFLTLPPCLKQLLLGLHVDLVF